MILTEEQYLEHYGVKGMRWGVRKTNRGAAGNLNVSRLRRQGADFLSDYFAKNS